jgi:D-alanyl-lipoteichoic acid acyltransferase DltB (MBOAT superfamily)
MIGWHDILAPFRAMPWAEWDFWRLQVFQGRHLGFWVLPLVPLAAMVARRHLYAAWASAGVAFSLWAFGPFFTVYLVCLIFGMYCLGEGLSRQCRRPDVNRSRTLAVAILIVVGTWLGYSALRQVVPGAPAIRWIMKHATFLLPQGSQHSERGLPSLFITPHFCGIAFLTLKLIHYLVEVHRGTIRVQDRGLLRFLSYCTFAPSFIQGPIDRYDHFLGQIEHARERWRPFDVAVGLWRIALGVAKKLIVLAYFEGFSKEFPGYLRAPIGGMTFKEFYYSHPEQLAYGQLWLGIWAMIFSLYLEFSGYCDMAVGMSRLVGYRMTEAFRWAWFSPSLLEFWRRWNITVGLWLRDYVYIPLGGSRSHVYRNYCLTFVVCGLWHVPNGTYAVWGLTLGIALAINRMWRELWSESPGRFRVPLSVQRIVRRARPLWRALGVAVTVNAFCLLVLVFFKNLPFGGRVAWQIFSRPVKALIF